MAPIWANQTRAKLARGGHEAVPGASGTGAPNRSRTAPVIAHEDCRLQPHNCARNCNQPSLWKSASLLRLPSECGHNGSISGENVEGEQGDRYGQVSVSQALPQRTGSTQQCADGPMDAGRSRCAHAINAGLRRPTAGQRAYIDRQAVSADGTFIRSEARAGRP